MQTINVTIDDDAGNQLETFHDNDDQTPQGQPVLTLHDRFPIHLTEDWSSGIGGGLWSTGLAMGHYFGTEHFWSQLKRLYQYKQPGKRILNSNSSHSRVPIRVLELGSGNGFLSVCLVVAAMLRGNYMFGLKDDVVEPKSGISLNDPAFVPIQVIATDTSTHLPLMTTTIQSNLRRIQSLAPTCSVDLTKCVFVHDYLWGDDPSTLFRKLAKQDIVQAPFDLIVGSDLAYRDELHDPLIAALQQFGKVENHDINNDPRDTRTTQNKTITLLGVTMTDTNPIFFEKLITAGFWYEKLADHLLQPQFRGGGSRQFGIFVIVPVS